MPGTSNFPAALDTFPDIDANTQENEEDVYHDVVHENVHAAIAALQAKVGIDDSEDVNSLDYKIANLVISDSSAVTDVSSVSGVLTLDLALGKFFVCVVHEDITSIVLDNAPAAGFGAQVHILFIQDDTTAYEVAGFPSAVFWFGDPYEISTGLEAVDEVVLTYYSTTRISGKYLKGSADAVPSYAAALLHFDGTDGSTTIVDESGKTWTAHGNAQLDTAAKKFGSASVLFDGTNSYITTAHDVSLNFGTGDFTIEFWQNTVSKTGYQTILSKGYASGGNGYLIQTGSGDGRINFYSHDTGANLIAGETTGTVTDGTQYHIAICRIGTSVKIYREGVEVASGTSSFDFSSTLDLFVGGGSATGMNNYWYNGYMDDLRITKGVGIYTSAFTPPAAPLT